MPSIDVHLLHSPVGMLLYFFKDGIMIREEFMGTNFSKLTSITQIQAATRRLFLHINNCISLKEINSIIFALDFGIFKYQLLRREFCRLCKKYDIVYYFVTDFQVVSYIALTLAKPIVNKGEKVVVLSSTIFSLSWFVFVYDGNQYHIAEFQNPKPPADIKKQDIVNIPGLKKVIFKIVSLYSNTEPEYVEDLRKYFKNYDGVTVNGGPDVLNNPELFAGLIKHLNGEIVNPYYPAVIGADPFTVEINQRVRKILFKSEDQYSLPYEKSFCFVVGKGKTVVLKSGTTIIEEIDITKFKGLKIKVSVSIDINFIYEFKAELVDEPPVEVPNLTDEIEKLTITPIASKPRVVFTSDEFSVILDNEKVLKDSSGNSKIPLYISFAKKKPEFGHKAVKASETEPTFVVYDILKFCLDDANVAQTDYKNFDVCKDNGETILEFDTAEGRRRATLPFFIALIFNYILKMIKAEAKLTLEELDVTFKDVETTNKMLMIFLKAADLLKLKISFV